VIDILIINYNCVSSLQALLESLLQGDEVLHTRRANYAVTVVDNCSRDGSVALVESRFPSVQILARPENGGYSAAVNEGLASTKNREILLLNSDVLITPSSVARLVRIWERLGFQSILAPLHFEPDGFPQLTWGEMPTPQAEAKRKKLELALSHRQPWAREEALTEACKTRAVDWVSGSCMFFSRSTALDIGPWDQNFFLYFEDLDWCLRARERGYSVYHTSEVQVIHQHGASVAADPDMAELEYRRSQCYFTQKYFGSWRLLQLRGYLTCKMMGRWLLGARSGFDRGTSFQILREIWRTPGI
jgi:N-acetylglucosaminyl-diphospho-decaprenol L-rhamnosyltransferase